MAEETKNRRKYPRFRVDQDMFVLAKTYKSLAMGDLKDISLGGAAFESVAIDNPGQELILDIVYVKKGLNLNDIQTQIVSDSIIDFQLAENGKSFLETHKYSVKFLNLEMDKRFHLDGFISEHILETFDLRQYK